MEMGPTSRKVSPTDEREKKLSLWKPRKGLIPACPEIGPRRQPFRSSAADLSMRLLSRPPSALIHPVSSRASYPHLANSGCSPLRNRVVRLQTFWPPRQCGVAVLLCRQGSPFQYATAAECTSALALPGRRARQSRARASLVSRWITAPNVSSITPRPPCLRRATRCVSPPQS